MPRVSIEPKDEPAIVARVKTALDAKGGTSRVRDLMIDLRRNGFSPTLSETAQLLGRSSGVQVDRDGAVRKA